MKKLNRIYEINTATYLDNLPRQHGKLATLNDIPDAKLRQIADYGFDAIWLMGVWQRSPKSTEIARAQENVVAEAKNLLSGFKPDDIIGSAYSIARYQIDEKFGGEKAVIKFHKRIKKLGMKLILDFVPNHTGLDHDWISNRPGCYIHPTNEMLSQNPNNYFKQGDALFALGKDPNFEPWSDVAQLNSFSNEYRDASVETFQYISKLADGARCDMAMLMTNETFAKTWGDLAGPVPEKEYWVEVTERVRQSAPDFVFIAESYWSSQQQLIGQGFDYCYDKDLYDSLISGTAESLMKHLSYRSSWSNRSIDFIENHDELRAASTLPLARHKAVAYLLSTLGSVWLCYEGQLDGYPYKIPVQLGREPFIEANSEIHSFYDGLLKKHSTKLNWELSPDNNNLLVGKHNDKTVAIINYSDVDQTTTDNQPLAPWQILEL